MPFQPPSSGLSNTAEYMTSGLPWVSSSAIPLGAVWTITFPFVTNHLTIKNSGQSASQMSVGFSLSGSQNSNNFVLNSTSTQNQSLSEQIRVTTLYLSASTQNVTASVYAGLTTIQAKHFPVLTGSTSNPFDITGSIPYNTLSYDGLG